MPGEQHCSGAPSTEIAPLRSAARARGWGSRRCAAWGLREVRVQPARPTARAQPHAGERAAWRKLKGSREMGQRGAALKPGCAHAVPTHAPACPGRSAPLARTPRSGVSASGFTYRVGRDRGVRPRLGCRRPLVAAGGLGTLGQAGLGLPRQGRLSVGKRPARLRARFPLPVQAPRLLPRTSRESLGLNSRENVISEG
jgi:hypothetical protein